MLLGFNLEIYKFNLYNLRTGRDVWSSFGPCLCSQTGEIQNDLSFPGWLPDSPWEPCMLSL